jgi:hypothetical protein
MNLVVFKKTVSVVPVVGVNFWLINLTSETVDTLILAAAELLTRRELKLK